jgi:hypothetical protein
LVLSGLVVAVLVLVPHRHGHTGTQLLVGAATGSVRVFLVLPHDDGLHGAAIGCGDSLIAYTPPGFLNTDPLEASVRELLAIPLQPATPVGAYNALGRSSLRVASIGIGDGSATVALVGTLRLGGVCDGPRVAAQLTATVTQFPQIRQARITINGVALGKVLALQG